MFENMSIEFMNLKTVLLEPDLVKKAAKFMTNSSAWLSYMAFACEPADFKQETSSLSPQKLFNVELLKKPSQAFNTAILVRLPEFFITNIVDLVIFLKRFKDSSIGDLFYDDVDRY